MKILLITLEYPPFRGGVANYYGNLVKYWPEKDNVFVLTPEVNPDNRVIQRKLINSLVFPRCLSAVWHLYWTVKKRKINHMLVGQILPLGTAAYLVSLITGVKYTVFIHGMDITYAQRRRRKRKMAKRILDRADKVICGNSYTAELTGEFMDIEINTKLEALNSKPRKFASLTRGKQDTKIATVNPGIEPINTDKYKSKAEQLRQNYNLKDKVVIFSIGRLVKRKGFDRVIKALPEAQKYVPNIAYVYAGDGPEKLTLRKSAKGVKNVIYMGSITDEEKWAWLRACDIFIMPARNINGDFEGFGIVYLEANLCGKPVIAGNSGGVKDAVKTTYTGLMVNPENTEDIANNIITLAKNKELREQMGENGRKRAVEEFKWENNIKQIHSIIYSI